MESETESQPRPLSLSLHFVLALTESICNIVNSVYYIQSRDCTSLVVVPSQNDNFARLPLKGLFIYYCAQSIVELPVLT